MSVADVHTLAAPATADPEKAARTARLDSTGHRRQRSRGDGLPVQRCRRADTPLHPDLSAPANTLETMATCLR